MKNKLTSGAWILILLCVGVALISSHAVFMVITDNLVGFLVSYIYAAVFGWFLTIDAINFKGHKKVTGSGVMFWKWLIKNNFPGGFRVLCWNCNSGRETNGGICPHEQLRRGN